MLLIGLGWYGYDKVVAHGKALQAAADKTEIDNAHTELDNATAQKNASAQALQQVNANAELEKQKAAIQQGQVEAAIEQLNKDKASAQSDAAAWQTKFKQASTTAACAGTLKEELCPALSDY
jgi:predicted RNA-binding protein